MPASRRPCRRHTPVAFALLIAALAFTAAPPATAGTNADARIVIHLLNKTTRDACTRTLATPPCAGIVAQGNLYPALYFAYLLVTNADAVNGLSGVQCGITYDNVAGSGVDIYTWNLCASLNWPSTGWPAAGGGNVIAWDNATRCQRSEPGGAGHGVVAAAGYFYLGAYSPDALETIVRPADASALVADCSNEVAVLEGPGIHHVPSRLGYASFSAGGATPGYNPCDPDPAAIDCTISGPDGLDAQTSGHVYTVPGAPAGATFLWSISGHGAIEGSTTNPSVSVIALTPGDMTLGVVVTAGGASAACEKTVIVGAAAPTCSITGPTQVLARHTGLTFDVAASGPTTSIEWTITGAGVITSGGHSAHVIVTAGEAGAFELTATVRTTDSGYPGTCRWVVTVVDTAPACTLSGLAEVSAGATGLSYAVTPVEGTLTGVTWSITGNGTITSDPHATPVTVTAGAVGAFELTAAIQTSLSALTGSCARIISVNPPGAGGCVITGPDRVGEGQRYVWYEVTSPDPISSVEWIITGNGHITAGAHAARVEVWAGSTGAFQLTATTRTGPDNLINTCSLTVTVLAWGNNCSIQGPTYVAVQDQAVTYTVIPPAGQLTHVTWSIRDFGTIISDPHANPVIVRPDSAGAYEISAVIGTDASPLPSNCYVDVTVIDTEILSCHIEGPESVTEGSPQVNYFVHTTGNVTALQWAISGNAILTSGGTGQSARVQVGDPGAFQLTVTLHGPGGAVESCSKTVTVNPIACAIAGSGSVVAGATGLNYTTGVALVGATYAWQITGDGSLVGDTNGPGVTVNAGAAGTFELSVTITRNGTAHACARTVTVRYDGGLHSQSNAKILVHLAPITTSDACGARGAPACGEVSTVGRLSPTHYFAYLLVVDGNRAAGVAGLECGIEYDAAAQSGVDILGWTLCAPSEVPSSGPYGPWPASGSGNRIRWDAATQCQRAVPSGNNAADGVVATAGYFYCAAYSSDRLAVVSRPGSGQAVVMDCGGSASVIDGVGHPAGNLPQLGFAGFSADGLVPGYNPCGVAAVLVRPTTWGSIKAMYATPPAKGTTP